MATARSPSGTSWRRWSRARNGQALLIAYDEAAVVLNDPQLANSPVSIPSAWFVTSPLLPLTGPVAAQS